MFNVPKTYFEFHRLVQQFGQCITNPGYIPSTYNNM